MKLLRSIMVLAAVLCIASCAHPPQAEIDAAQAAMDAAAKNADVVTYAPDSLRVAQEKILAANLPQRLATRLATGR